MSVTRELLKCGPFVICNICVYFFLAEAIFMLFSTSLNLEKICRCG